MIVVNRDESWLFITNEMKAKKLQLILPKSLHCTYTEEQKKWITDMNSFIQLVLERQRLATG